MLPKCFRAISAALLFCLPVLVVHAENAPKPQMFKENMVDIQATVSAIDHDTRMVTLTTDDGREVDFVAGEEIKNLAQVEVGDKVTAQYYQSMAVTVRKAEGSMMIEANAGGSTADPGDKPMLNSVGEMTLVARIEAIDRENQTVLLKGVDESGIGVETVRVQNPANLENVEVGDQVVITYLEAMAISVTEAP